MIMKPESILIVVCALCVGFSVVARANDSDKEGREVKETATPAVPVASEEKPDEAKQAAWEEKEVELLKAVKEVIAVQSKAREDDALTNWTSVENNVKSYLFQHATYEGEVKWPASQFGWVRSAADELRREKRRVRGKFLANRELDALTTLQENLTRELQVLNETDGGDAEVAPGTEGDETLWKFRDKGGSRTTKPRYKGQEPVN